MTDIRDLARRETLKYYEGQILFTCWYLHSRFAVAKLCSWLELESCVVHAMLRVLSITSLENLIGRCSQDGTVMCYIWANHHSRFAGTVHVISFVVIYMSVVSQFVEFHAQPDLIFHEF